MLYSPQTTWQIILQAKNGTIDDGELFASLQSSLPENLATLKKVLVIPHDFTRLHSGAGKITAMYYDILHKFCQVDILPALGTHEPMTDAEFRQMFGEKIPLTSIIHHNWRYDVEKIGEVPARFVKEISQGCLEENITVEINRKLLKPDYDLIKAAPAAD